jgi:hypothetical protein
VGQGGSYGYGTLFFWKGRYFVSVYAERESAPAREAVMALGRAVAASIGETGDPPALARRLPRAGLDETSLVYLRHPRILEAHVPVGPDNPLGVGPQAPVTGRYRRAVRPTSSSSTTRTRRPPRQRRRPSPRASSTAAVPRTATTAGGPRQS